MPVPLLQEKISDFSTTTILAPLSMDLQNGREKLKEMALHLVEDIRPEMKEDIYDPTYQDEVGPPPKLEYVWRTIIPMALLHLGALYGLTLVPGCKAYTWLWVPLNKGNDMYTKELLTHQRSRVAPPELQAISMVEKASLKSFRVLFLDSPLSKTNNLL
ncbi:acyl-CoA desaturase 3-like [Dipodomys merriami]|uniref:acyl-CoA desaturase 3-like n=1 Tax=Dipodomys merriami TaxID=94247 RepID=UPI00384EC1CB